MKKLLLMAALLSGVATTAWSQNNGKSVLCLGNGEMGVYEEGADIFQLFGPPYTSPVVMQLLVDGDLDVASQREFGTAIWTHSLGKGGEAVGTLVDFVDGELPAFVRSVENGSTIEFTLKLHAKTQALPNTPLYQEAGATSALMLTSPAGTYAYQDIYYPTPVENYYELVTTGDASMTQLAPDTWKVECRPGSSRIMVVSGRSYPACVTNTSYILATGYDQLLARTRQYWLDYTARGIDYASKLPADVPQRERLLQLIDDVSIIIKTQQAAEGSVIAGYNYRLGYVRDQYGVSRGLIKLGHVAEAVEVMDFYWDIWKRKGMIKNAQGVGIDAFHVHENDEVEITGYLIIQAFDLYKATGDDAYIEKIFPMLQWAFDCQVRNLRHDMLPFNGDETYIAGGILPRTAMFDGSAEATMLFITGGDLLADWAERHGMWDKSALNDNRAILKQVRTHYNDNFIDRDGRLMTNNSARKVGLEYPEFRHGVCESCYRLDWTHRSPNNRYLCANCIIDKELPPAVDEKFYLQSVALLPWYIGSDVLTDRQVSAFVQQAAEAYASTGKLPSRPDGNRTVGYDYGLFLFALTRMDNPLKDKLYEQMLSVVDDKGSWVEYYENGVPAGTFCRPWESAINIEAAIDYAENYK